MGFYFSVVVVVITVTSFELVIREGFYHAPRKKKLEHSRSEFSTFLISFSAVFCLHISASREKER
jgi:hypothetical protein